MLDFIAPASFQVAPDHLQINDQFVKTLFVYSYPRFLNSNWLSLTDYFSSVYSVVAGMDGRNDKIIEVSDIIVNGKKAKK